MNIFYFIILTTLLVRLFSLRISIRNEKSLKKEGAVEFGASNSILLAICHTVFYLSCYAEAIYRGTQWDNISAIGLVGYCIAIAFLFWVIRELKSLWTVKLIISKKHAINKSFLFKYVRHPNYFLNILPELVCLTMIFHSWNTLKWGFPLYLIPLTIRIVQEERVMRKAFINY